MSELDFEPSDEVSSTDTEGGLRAKEHRSGASCWDNTSRSSRPRPSGDPEGRVGLAEAFSRASPARSPTSLPYVKRKKPQSPSAGRCKARKGEGGSIATSQPEPSQSEGHPVAARWRDPERAGRELATVAAVARPGSTRTSTDASGEAQGGGSREKGKDRQKASRAKPDTTVEHRRRAGAAPEAERQAGDLWRTRLAQAPPGCTVQEVISARCAGASGAKVARVRCTSTKGLRHHEADGPTTQGEGHSGLVEAGVQVESSCSRINVLTAKPCSARSRRGAGAPSCSEEREVRAGAQGRGQTRAETGRGTVVEDRTYVEEGRTVGDEAGASNSSSGLRRAAKRRTSIAADTSRPPKVRRAGPGDQGSHHVLGRRPGGIPGAAQGNSHESGGEPYSGRARSSIKTSTGSSLVSESREIEHRCESAHCSVAEFMRDGRRDSSEGAVKAHANNEQGQSYGAILYESKAANSVDDPGHDDLFGFADTSAGCAEVGTCTGRGDQASSCQAGSEEASIGGSGERAEGFAGVEGGEFKEAIEWCFANELSATDLKNAFSCREKAIAYSGIISVGSLWDAIPAEAVGSSFTWSMFQRLVNPPMLSGSEIRCNLSSESSQVKVFRGPSKAAKVLTPSMDTDKRRQAAWKLLELAMTWTTVQGGLYWQSLQVNPDQRAHWLESQVARIASSFEAKSMHGALRGWSNWVSWCSAHQCEPIRPWPGATLEFLYDTKKKSVPLCRWNAFRFLMRNLQGCPAEVSQQQRPRSAKTGLVEEESGAATLEPELMLQLEQESSVIAKHDKELHRVVIYALWLCIATLRYLHCQRSVLICLGRHTLVGACLRGKGTPGFFWVTARYSASGIDIGGTIWKWWYSAAEHFRRKKQGVPTYIFMHEDHTAWMMHEWLQGLRHVFHRWVGLDAESTNLVSTYSFRRFNPTLAGILRVERLEAVALGHWTNAPTDMPLRYHGEKAASAKTVKLALVLVLRDMVRQQVRPLSWDKLRSVVSTKTLDAAREEALLQIANDEEIETTPPEWVEHLVRRKRSFSLRGLKAKKIVVPKPVVAPPCKEPELPTIESPNEELHWQVTNRSQVAVVHIVEHMDKDSAVPWWKPRCDRRQKKVAVKSFKRVAASGSTVKSLRDMSFRQDDKCRRCFDHATADERRKLLSALREG
jgi:hypothetical protein